MNELKLIQNQQTMSSLEIAKLTGKDHKNVLRDIDTLLKELGSNLSLGFKSTTYKDSSGKSNRSFELDRDSSICLISGYDAVARMKIIKRWQELEASKPKSWSIIYPLSQLQDWLLYGIIQPHFKIYYRAIHERHAINSTVF